MQSLSHALRACCDAIGKNIAVKHEHLFIRNLRKLLLNEGDTRLNCKLSTISGGTFAYPSCRSFARLL